MGRAPHHLHCCWRGLFVRVMPVVFAFYIQATHHQKPGECHSIHSEVEHLPSHQESVCSWVVRRSLGNGVFPLLNTSPCSRENRPNNVPYMVWYREIHKRYRHQV